MEYETFGIYPLNPIAHFTYFMFLHNSNFFYFLSFILQLSWGIINVKSNWMIWWVLIGVQPQNPHHTYCNLKLKWSELLLTPRRSLCELGERVPAAQQKVLSARTPRVVRTSGLDSSSPLPPQPGLHIANNVHSHERQSREVACSSLLLNILLRFWRLHPGFRFKVAEGEYSVASFSHCKPLKS